MKRRSFIQDAAILTAAMAAALPYTSFAKERRLKIGLIGCGWYGMVITTTALKIGGVEIVAICDVDSEHLKNSAEEIEKLQGSRPKKFKDYRDLLDIKELEVVIIATPPHWHALQFIDACEKGLDIYCEKPLSYDIEESKAMMKAAEKADNIVQIGFQRRQSQALQQAKELIEAGTLGKVHMVKPQIHYNLGYRDATIQDPPPSLDWEAWCGPAPMLPFSPGIGHRNWRLEKEYGNGHLVDWGIHYVDIIRETLNLKVPLSLYSKGDINVFGGMITTPDTLSATMNFEECTVIWEHRFWGTGDMHPEFNNGIFYYGEKATLFAGEDRLVLRPADKDKQVEDRILPTPDTQERHVANFLTAVKTKDNGILSCPIEDAFQSTTTVLLAMISYYTESIVKWDPVKKTIVDNDRAANLLARPYRGEYKRPII